ncbi:hypothetical protein N2152v2_006556 [Parachlorella kessleri]
MSTLYEQQRQERIQQNRLRLEQLGIVETAQRLRAEHPPPPKRQRQLRSGRQRREVSYAEEPFREVMAAHAPHAEEREPLPDYSPPDTREATVLPSFSASEGRRDAQGRLVFEDRPDFRPNLTPKQVIQAGSFGGIYFNPSGGKPGIRGSSVAVDPGEHPADWFEGLPRKAYAARIYTVGTNKYKVKAGQDQAFWEQKGWIHSQDPRGWFQWYCRFYQGRRTEDDDRQISRWKGVVGDKGRWVRALVNKVLRSNKRYDDTSVSPVIRQTLLHWAFELTEGEFERMRGHP